MLDLETAEFQASTLTYEQLQFYTARAYQAWQESLDPPTVYSRWLESLYKIYADALQAKIDEMIDDINETSAAYLIIYTDSTFYWFDEDQGHLIRPLVLEQLYAGEHVWWDDGTEQWVLHEEPDPRIWNRDQTQYLVNVNLYTLRDGVTTVVVLEYYWVTP